ncbi:MAG: TetR/AcrR family transcriptional regulator [Lachnospiraceae bacterium]|nr:TetR/AcrR family transcriptional regulator [Lachnospiraceae bacterium]
MGDDLRIKKTKRSIYRAYHELIQKKNRKNITVKEITEKAEINKSTFYYHYETIDVLLRELEDEFIDELISVLPFPDNNVSSNLQIIFGKLKKYNFEKILRWNKIDTEFLEVLSDRIVRVLKGMELPCEELAFWRNYYIFLITGLIELFHANVNTKEFEIDTIEDFLEKTDIVIEKREIKLQE